MPLATTWRHAAAAPTAGTAATGMGMHAKPCAAPALHKLVPQATPPQAPTPQRHRSTSAQKRRARTPPRQSKAGQATGGRAQRGAQPQRRSQPRGHQSQGAPASIAFSSLQDRPADARHWTAQERNWLASLLNAAIEGMLVLAPQAQIGTSVVLQHHRDFARWLYQRMDERQKAALKRTYSAAPAQIGHVLWPVMRQYLQAHHADSVAGALRTMHLASMAAPHTWFPLAKSLPRRVVYHAGPTNSGKTFQALAALRAAPSGVYCGPLRLLAAEVAAKLNGEGLPCSLVTGQERDEKFGAAHVACTTEMASTEDVYDVAVVDEVQLIKDDQRGWAWTRALLGLAARDIHVCGDPSCVTLVSKLCASAGVAFELQTYERLTPLQIDERGLVGRDYANVQPGDCVIAFSRPELYQIKAQIEEKAGRRVALVYGALPPLTRRAQADLFNDPGSDCEVLVASDAIGMGLNLNIRRIIFHTLRWFDPAASAEVPVAPDRIRQIAGRAGRKGTAHETGLVCTRRKSDQDLLAAALATSSQDETEAQARLAPLFEQVEQYAHCKGYPEQADFVSVLDHFGLEAAHGDLYLFTSHDQHKSVAAMMAHLDLTLAEQWTFCTAPVDVRKAVHRNALQMLLERYAASKYVPLRVCLPSGAPTSAAEMQRLEAAYGVLDYCLWLALRLPGAFPDLEAMQIAEQQLARLLTEGVAVVMEAKPGKGADGISSEYDEIFQFADGTCIPLTVPGGSAWQKQREMLKLGKKLKAERVAVHASQEAPTQAPAHAAAAQASAQCQPAAGRSAQAQMAALSWRHSAGAARLATQQSLTPRALAH